jgi:hypothetical protein
MPKVHVRAAQCAHIASLSADTYFIMDEHGPRWVCTSTNHQAMIAFEADTISVEEFTTSVIYELSETVKRLLLSCCSGVVVISVRSQKISFTHDYDQLIRRASDTVDTEKDVFAIELGESKSFRIRYEHWVRMMPMMETDVVRVDTSSQTVTFSGDDCGAACACTGSSIDTFQMNYIDWEFLFDRWPKYHMYVDMGVGENGVLYISTERVKGFMSPVL